MTWKGGLLWFGLMVGYSTAQPPYRNDTVVSEIESEGEFPRPDKSCGRLCEEYVIEYCKRYPYTTTKTETYYVTVDPSPYTITIT